LGLGSALCGAGSLTVRGAFEASRAWGRTSRAGTLGTGRSSLSGSPPQASTLDRDGPRRQMAFSAGSGCTTSSIGQVMAVENDYNLLVHNLNELEKTISQLRDEVEARRLREAKEQLEPNTTAVRVMASQPGEAALDALPPSAPETPPA
jgi:hypothetical protein